MPTIFGNIYSGKKIFITGHTGFKGSWLSLWLTELGATVCGYSDSIPTSPSHFELLQLPIKTITGDILDYQKLSQAIRTFQPDLVFHLAAQPLVCKSYQNPVETFSVNVVGTAQVLEACRGITSIKGILNVTTDKCYENKESGQAYVESDPLGGYDPYSASKACSEILTASYRNSFFNLADFGSKHATLVASARSGNVIGGGDWAEDRIVPDIIRGIVAKQTVEIRNPAATRPWQHVLEPLSGYLLLGQKLLEKDMTAAEAWNFGPNPELSVAVGTLVTDIKKLWPEFSFSLGTPPKLHEAQQLALDSSKSNTQLGWQNIWDYEESIEKTTAWYKTFIETKEITSKMQLESYLSDALDKKVDWIQK